MTELTTIQSSGTSEPGSVDASRRWRLVVIVPAYNEEEGIGRTVRSVREAVVASCGTWLEDLRIYVIDDGSDDLTGPLAKEAGADRVLRHRVNIGLGAAVRTGLAAARSDGADMVVKFDADLQHDPNDICELLEPLLQDEADLVYGNRFPRIEYKMPFVRRVGNKAFTGLMRYLTKWPLEDSQPGIFAANRAYLEVFSVPGDYNYTQQVLLDAYHKGMRFAHVPVTFRERTVGRSFVSLTYPLKVLPQILLVLVGVRPLRVFGGIGLLFLLLGGAVFIWDFTRWMSGIYPDPAEHVNLILGSSLFGLQSVFFGILAHLVIHQGRGR